MWRGRAPLWSRRRAAAARCPLSGPRARPRVDRPTRERSVAAAPDTKCGVGSLYLRRPRPQPDRHRLKFADRLEATMLADRHEVGFETPSPQPLGAQSRQRCASAPSRWPTSWCQRRRLCRRMAPSHGGPHLRVGTARAAVWRWRPAPESPRRSARPASAKALKRPPPLASAPPTGRSHASLTPREDRLRFVAGPGFAARRKD